MKLTELQLDERKALVGDGEAVFRVVLGLCQYRKLVEGLMGLYDLPPLAQNLTQDVAEIEGEELEIDK